jgi:hypothetical protein
LNSAVASSTAREALLLPSWCVGSRFVAGAGPQQVKKHRCYSIDLSGNAVVQLRGALAHKSWWLLAQNKLRNIVGAT